MISRISAFIAMFGACLFLLAGVGVHAQAPAAPTQPVTMADGYVLGPGDVVEVTVLGRDEYKPRVEVQTDGTVLLPYLKSVPAANRTLLQLRDDVQAKLKEGGFYTDPVVTVTLVKAASRYVTVLGEVGTPGLVPVDRVYRVSEILARVGGAKDSGADELALRRADGQEIKLSVRDIASGGPEQDPIVNPGDKVYLPAAPMFYIYGQVSAPGTYRVDREMTLRKALARGGGLTERGSDHRVKVYRNGQELAHFNLGDPIQGGDTIVVGERLF